MDKNLIDDLVGEDEEVDNTDSVIAELRDATVGFVPSEHRKTVHAESMNFLERIHAEIRLKNEGHRPLIVDKTEDEE